MEFNTNSSPRWILYPQDGSLQCLRLGVPRGRIWLLWLLLAPYHLSIRYLGTWNQTELNPPDGSIVAWKFGISKSKVVGVGHLHWIRGDLDWNLILAIREVSPRRVPKWEISWSRDMLSRFRDHAIKIWRCQPLWMLTLFRRKRESTLRLMKVIWNRGSDRLGSTAGPKRSLKVALSLYFNVFHWTLSGLNPNMLVWWGILASPLKWTCFRFANYWSLVIPKREEMSLLDLWFQESRLGAGGIQLGKSKQHYRYRNRKQVYSRSLLHVFPLHVVSPFFTILLILKVRFSQKAVSVRQQMSTEARIAIQMRRKPIPHLPCFWRYDFDRIHSSQKVCYKCIHRILSSIV